MSLNDIRWHKSCETSSVVEQPEKNEIIHQKPWEETFAEKTHTLSLPQRRHSGNHSLEIFRDSSLVLFSCHWMTLVDINRVKQTQLSSREKNGTTHQKQREETGLVEPIDDGERQLLSSKRIVFQGWGQWVFLQVWREQYDSFSSAFRSSQSFSSVQLFFITELIHLPFLCETILAKQLRLYVYCTWENLQSTSYWSFDNCSR